MNTQILIPHPALQPYIQNYLYYETGTEGLWTRADTSPTALPVMAFAMEKEQCIYKEFGRHEPLLLCGQLTKYSQIHAFGRMRLFYVFFSPVGAYYLLDTPQKELRNSMVNISDLLLGTAARILKEKLKEQTTIIGLRQVIETFFLKWLSQKKKNDSALRLAHAIKQIELNSHHRNVITEVCHQHGYSISRLERHMQQMVGIGPKLLQRIFRFNNVLNYINQRQSPYPWAGIARQFGYFDQTHLIKDFTLFYGTTPGKIESSTSKKLQLSLSFSGEEESGKSPFRVYE